MQNCLEKHLQACQKKNNKLGKIFTIHRQMVNLIYVKRGIKN